MFENVGLRFYRHVRRRHFIILETADRYGCADLAAIAPYHDGNFSTHIGLCHHARQGSPAGYLAPTKAQNHIALAHIACCRWSIFNYRRNQRAGRPRQAIALGNFRRHALNTHAEPAAYGATKLTQLVDHYAGDVGWSRKADTDAAARG